MKIVGGRNWLELIVEWQDLCFDTRVNVILCLCVCACTCTLVSMLYLSFTETIHTIFVIHL